LLATASGSWVELADEFEELLVLDDTSELLPEDEKFLQSQKLFWILNKIDELLPMMSDEIIQWTWFRDSNNLGPLTSADLSDEKDSVGLPTQRCQPAPGVTSEAWHSASQLCWVW
jgi:hypothetical protein